MGSQKLTVNDCSLTHLKLFFEWLGRSACNDVWKFAVIDPCLLALFGYRTAHIWLSTNSFSWIHWRLLRTASGYTEALPLKEARAWLESSIWRMRAVTVGFTVKTSATRMFWSRLFACFRVKHWRAEVEPRAQPHVWVQHCVFLMKPLQDAFSSTYLQWMYLYSCFST